MRVWRAAAWALAAMLLLVAVALVGAALLVPSASPRVAQAPRLEVTDVERALRLARQHDPRQALPGVVRALRLTQHEAEVLLNQAAARLGGGAWRVEIGADRLRVLGSVPLPKSPLGAWLDLELEAHATQGLPRLHAVRAGRLPLPPALLQWLLLRWAEAHDLGGPAPVLALHRVGLQPQRLDLLYAWGPDAPARLAGVLLPERERERLRAYAARLAEIAARDASRPLSVTEVLPPLFELARERSRGGRDAALENRAALLVLGMVANGVGLATLLPERRQELATQPVRLTLAGRRDFPQHLLLSAALAADSGGRFADLLGLYKELSDARWGSGFSFNDIAANRAGARLGELAVQDPQLLQGRLAGALSESDFMPDVSDLPEFLNEREFRTRYGAPGTPAYERLMGDIEQRLQATPLFRGREP